MRKREGGELERMENCDPVTTVLETTNNAKKDLGPKLIGTCYTRKEGNCV